MLNRIEPNLEPALVLNDLETSILDRLIPGPKHDPPGARTLSLHLAKIARLRGYVPRAKDPPPGNILNVAQPLPSERHNPRIHPASQRCR